jgi:hypothetical protein
VRKSTDHRAAGDAPSRAQGAGLSFSGPARIQIGRVLSLRFVARPTLDGARVGSARPTLLCHPRWMGRESDSGNGSGRSNTPLSSRHHASGGRHMPANGKSLDELWALTDRPSTPLRT